MCKYPNNICNIWFKQIWPDQGDWNYVSKLTDVAPMNIKFKQIWPDQGDWNTLISRSSATSNEFKQIWPDKGDWILSPFISKTEFKQIWPDQGDWNISSVMLAATFAI